MPYESADAQFFGGGGYWNGRQQVRSYRRYDRPYQYNRRYRRPSYRRGRNGRRGTRKPATASHFKVDKSLKGPVQIVVSLPRQRVTVYKGGKTVASSPVSTGKPGHGTPSGVFSIIQKHRQHFSNLYGGASMPYMQRITWSGVALHAGVVPGYPASHGCIRLPAAFAQKLFGFTKMGAHVVVAREQSVPAVISHATLFQPTPLAEITGAKADAAGGSSESAGSAELLDERSIADGSFGITRRRTAALADAGDDAAQSAALALLSLEARFERIQAYRNRSKAPLRILVTRRNGKERHKDLQRLLNELGYDVGPADGWIGKQTIAAIKRFQADNGLASSGTVSESLYGELYRVAGKQDDSTGHIYVRQNFKDIFDAPVTLGDPGRPLGTHLYTAMHMEKGAREVAWTALTVTSRAKLRAADAQTSIPGAVITAGEALDRIEIPAHVRTRISDLLTPGSSLVISDNGISHETGRGTDFVVLTK